MIYGYCRVSTTAQGGQDKTSIEEQERRIRAWAGTLMDEPDPQLEIFHDEISGAMPLSERPSGSIMLAKAQPGDTIVSLKMTRLFRSAVDALTSVEEFHKRGIKVVLMDISHEPIKESGVARMFFQIMAAVAEFEKYRLLEQMRDGRAAKKFNGGFIGGQPPFGYRAVGRGSKAILVKDEKEQEVVTLIHTLHAESGRGKQWIAGELDRRGIKTRKGTKFDQSQVRRVLNSVPIMEAAE